MEYLVWPVRHEINRFLRLWPGNTFNVPTSTLGGAERSPPQPIEGHTSAREGGLTASMGTSHIGRVSESHCCSLMVCVAQSWFKKEMTTANKSYPISSAEWKERTKSSSRAPILQDILKQQVNVRKFTSMVTLQHRYWPQAQGPATEGLQRLPVGVFWRATAQRHHVKLKTSKIRDTPKIMMSTRRWEEGTWKLEFN